MIERDRDPSGGTSLTERLYVAQDANYNVTSLFDTSGNVQERDTYDAYGQVTFYDASWIVRASSSVGMNYLWQGFRTDVGLGVGLGRGRVYSYTVSRWLQQDPIPSTNLYLMEGDQPVNRLDPSGLDPFPSYTQVTPENAAAVLAQQREAEKASGFMSSPLYQFARQQLMKQGPMGVGMVLGAENAVEMAQDLANGAVSYVEHIEESVNRMDSGEGFWQLQETYLYSIVHAADYTQQAIDWVQRQAGGTPLIDVMRRAEPESCERGELTEKGIERLIEIASMFIPAGEGVAVTESASLRLYEVGLAKDLRKVPIKGMFTHHVPQSAQAQTLIGDFNTVNKVGNEAAIRILQSEHEAINAAQAARPRVPASALELLQQDIAMLREFTQASGQVLNQLQELAMNLHPWDFIK